MNHLSTPGTHARWGTIWGGKQKGLSTTRFCTTPMMVARVSRQTAWIELHGGDVGLSGTVGDLTDTGVPGDAADDAGSGGDSDVEDGDYADDGMGDAAAELDD